MTPLSWNFQVGNFAEDTKSLRRHPVESLILSSQIYHLVHCAAALGNVFLEIINLPTFWPKQNNIGLRKPLSLDPRPSEKVVGGSRRPKWQSEKNMLASISKLCEPGRYSFPRTWWWWWWWLCGTTFMVVIWNCLFWNRSTESVLQIHIFSADVRGDKGGCLWKCRKIKVTITTNVTD